MTLLLVIIYITFISLGLPDAILGSAWPKMYTSLHTGIASAGIMTMIISGGTIISSLFSNQLITRFGTAKVTIVSVFMTAVGLLGISVTPTFLIMCLLGIPLGLGAGAVDSALNNFVAVHYKARHMNWLHCFWGIGATAGPMLMSFYLLQQNGWRSGYLLIGVFQIALVIGLFFTLPIWKKHTKMEASPGRKETIRLTSLIKISGARSAFLGFFCYSSIEMIVGLWGSSYLVLFKGVTASTAAIWIALFYIGITLGRFISGIMTYKVNNRNMIRIGQFLVFSGFIFLLLPVWMNFQLVGFILIGLGCAPIYPSMLQETPNRFGRKVSQGIMGIQMAIAYIGSTFMPPLVGYFSTQLGFGILPIIIASLLMVMILATENSNRLLLRKESFLQY